VALGSTQPLTEMSTRNPSWGKGGRCWQPYHLHVPIVYKFWSLNLLEPLGPVQACRGKALPLNDLCSHMHMHIKTPLHNHFICLGNNFKTCCIMSVLFSTKCHLFHNFILFCSNNTHVSLLNHVLKFKYQPSCLEVNRL
jgi:hypothetical protein